MGDIIKFDNGSDLDLVENSKKMLEETRESIDSMELPIDKIATLGAGVASLLPIFNSGTISPAFGTETLYKVVNMGKGEFLKMAKNGNNWGAFLNAEGKSIMAQFQPVDPISSTSAVAMKANPATIMLAIALYSIEKDLDKIEEMEKQIIDFLESEKQSEIEADVVTLNEMLSKYKNNWDNDKFISSNHKMVCDIQRTARKNIIFYRKSVSETMKEKKLLISDGKVNSKLRDLQKKFQYYRLSLYSYSLASLSEIMLSGNFASNNIETNMKEIENYATEYVSLFEECSKFLETLSDKSLGNNLKKGVGNASKSLGKLISNIPKVKDGKLDEFLLEKGESIKDSALEVSLDVIESFNVVGNTGVGVFLKKMKEMDFIYNKATEIRADNENIYLAVV